MQNTSTLFERSIVSQLRHLKSKIFTASTVWGIELGSIRKSVVE